MATCKLDVIDLTLGFDSYKIDFSVSQDVSALVIVSLNMLIVIIFVYFIFVLDRKQHDFAEVYKDYSIQMDDFTVMVNNLPGKKSYTHQSEEILRMQLWEHFDKILKI